MGNKKPPKEVSEWMRQIQAKRETFKGGRPITKTDEKAKKNRERVRAHRQRQKANKGGEK